VQHPRFTDEIKHVIMDLSGELTTNHEHMKSSVVGIQGLAAVLVGLSVSALGTAALPASCRA
jgi:hypothetical protein